jgi:hypothetical protein
MRRKIGSVGRANIKRRKRAHHLPKARGNPGPAELPQGYLVEERITQAGLFSRGLRDAGPAQWRIVRTAFLWCAGAFIVIVLVAWAVNAIWG